MTPYILRKILQYALHRNLLNFLTMDTFIVIFNSIRSNYYNMPLLKFIQELPKTWYLSPAKMAGISFIEDVILSNFKKDSTIFKQIVGKNLVYLVRIILVIVAITRFLKLFILFVLLPFRLAMYLVPVEIFAPAEIVDKISLILSYFYWGIPTQFYEFLRMLFKMITNLLTGGRVIVKEEDIITESKDNSLPSNIQPKMLVNIIKPVDKSIDRKEVEVEVEDEEDENNEEGNYPLLRFTIAITVFAIAIAIYAAWGPSGGSSGGLGRGSLGSQPDPSGSQSGGSYKLPSWSQPGPSDQWKGIAPDQIKNPNIQLPQPDSSLTETLLTVPKSIFAIIVGIWTSITSLATSRNLERLAKLNEDGENEEDSDGTETEETVKYKEKVRKQLTEDLNRGRQRNKPNDDLPSIEEVGDNPWGSSEPFKSSTSTDSQASTSSEKGKGRVQEAPISSQSSTHSYPPQPRSLVESKKEEFTGLSNIFPKPLFPVLGLKSAGDIDVDKTPILGIIPKNSGRRYGCRKFKFRYTF